MGYYFLFPMENFGQAQRLIEQYDIITIFGHAQPDGDCYGSQIGLREMIKLRYPEKKVYAVGTGLPQFFERLGEMDDVSDEEIANSLVVLVDVSCLRRCEDNRCYTGKDFLKFDHHRPNKETEPFEGCEILDYHRISACELIVEFGIEYGYTITKRIAECFYLGIITDSGRLRFHGTTQKTIDLCNYLMKVGVDKKAVEAIAFYRPPHIVAFDRYIKRKAKIRGNVAYAIITQKNCDDNGVTNVEALHMVNSLADKDCHSYCIFVQFGENFYRVELRSNKGYPVYLVARRHKGGGHKYAAGCDVDIGFDPDEVSEVLNELNELEVDINDDD